MAKTFTTELPDDETKKEMDAAMQPYRKQISETPKLLSLLYDIDLLPEQIVLPMNVNRLIAVCELWRNQRPGEEVTWFTLQARRYRR